jgi:hypothetical protein
MLYFNYMKPNRHEPGATMENLLDTYETIKYSLYIAKEFDERQARIAAKYARDDMRNELKNINSNKMEYLQEEIKYLKEILTR